MINSYIFGSFMLRYASDCFQSLRVVSNIEVAPCESFDCFFIALFKSGRFLVSKNGPVARIAHISDNLRNNFGESQ